ncbi:NADH dehydrogenase (quinone) [Chloroherpeton thalassium ATCC 35110]|uniref:NADH-quinone oxidoreductase subunit H n=1 Tax=Chloroherpeton thalassium (strain ATCC 35110 / GB-78) TaxID=517418 RepID=B3QVB9_CHLT3|nr:NADH-quinone oxidoreductase subunit NuoH [Chloroherpeton thalassium]ACF13073.1 NADH dehydrogenase (quinone) [Chloroherpeton thalassium ATCC 35110]
MNLAFASLDFPGRMMLMGVVLFVLLTAVAYTVYAERRIAALIQNRLGPNRVGPFGLLQPLADVLKLLLKEDIVPKEANRFFHLLGPMISLFAALSTIAVVPYAYGWAIADVSIGILYVLAITSLGVYGLTISGWASNSKYSLLGGLRSSAQMISYEIAMGLAIVSVVVLSDSLSMTAIVESQTSNPLYWNCFRNVLGFIIFTVAAFAETNRTPFDLPEAEQELVGGYHTEYSSMKFALFFLAEYANMIVASTVITTLFLGGYQVPFLDSQSGLDGMLLALLQVGAFVAKTLFMMFVFIWVRWTLPRFKYNQLMDLGWKKLLPLALFNLLLVSFGVIAVDAFLGQ